MIHYPIQCLVNAGIRDILIVTGGSFAGDFLQLLGNGKEFGLKELHYTYQEGEGGIADALRLAEDFADGGKLDPSSWATTSSSATSRGRPTAFARQERGAKILLKEVPTPSASACPSSPTGASCASRRSPQPAVQPRGDRHLHVRPAGLRHDPRLEPSARGELEITDVNNMYLDRGSLQWSELEGWWTDAGTFPSLLRASNLVAESGANGCATAITARIPRRITPTRAWTTW
jgi:glucose-1-phosphate thymidylyltransferase